VCTMESLEQDVATCGHENKKRRNIKQELHPNSEYTLQKRLELYKSKHPRKCFLEFLMHFLFLLKAILKWVETRKDNMNTTSMKRRTSTQAIVVESLCEFIEVLEVVTSLKTFGR